LIYSINKRKEVIIFNRHFLIPLLMIFYFSCSDDPTSSNDTAHETGTLTDIDSNVYQTIKIGTQWWMAENLKATHYRNGEAIANVTEDTIWYNLTTSAYCNYDNNPDTAAIYGRLYNWFAVVDSRKIAPNGWHVPTDAEWKKLEMFLGMSQDDADIFSDQNPRGTDEGSKMKATGTIEEGNGLWYTLGYNVPDATNESGFSAIPGGFRIWYTGVKFRFLGLSTLFWSTTDYNSDLAILRGLGFDNSRVHRYRYSKWNGLSVRCVKD
jgi:uncharacterized protein (TIGR02145 family)